VKLGLLHFIIISLLEKELEKSASRKLKINAKETMKIAEKLYTAGYISYPRTETNIFPKDFDLTSLIEKQTGDQNWGRTYFIKLKNK
jgi:DNA topoisomerase-3